MTEKEEYILKMMRDFKFKGCKFPDVANPSNDNFPPMPENIDCVRIPREKYNMFRDSYVLLSNFVALITKGKVTTDYEMTELLMGEARGDFELLIVRKWK